MQTKNANRFNILNNDNNHNSRVIESKVINKPISLPIYSDDGFTVVKQKQKQIIIKSYKNYIPPTPKCKPGPNSVVIKINGKCVYACDKWIEYCKQPYNMNESFKCLDVNHHINNPNRDMTMLHLPIPLCRNALTGICKMGNTCSYDHIDNDKEIKFSDDIPKVYQRKIMCIKNIIYYMSNGVQPKCNISKCKYAHTHDDLYIVHKQPDFNIYPPNKVYEAVYIIMIFNTNNYNKLLEMFRKCGKTPPSDSRDMNIKELLRDYSYALNLASVFQPELYEKITGPFTSAAIWYSKHLQECNRDPNNINNMALWRGGLITDKEICYHGANCIRGSHIIVGTATRICFDDLYGSCNCENKTSFIHLCATYKCANVINMTKKREYELQCIIKEDTVFSYNSYMNIMPTNMSASERKQYDIKMKERTKRLEEISKLYNLRAIEEQKQMLEKEINAKKIALLGMNQKKWFNSGAWCFFDYYDWINKSEFYMMWKTSSLNLLWKNFETYAQQKKEEWEDENNMKMILEYKDLKGYIYGLPIHKDSRIVENHIGIHNVLHDVWNQYIVIHSPFYNLSFIDYIKMDKILLGGYNLHTLYPHLPLISAIQYVKLDFIKTNVSFIDYCKYDNITTSLWIKMWHKLHDNMLPIISIEEFVVSRVICVDFFLKSGHIIYGMTVAGMDAFIKNTNEGWKIYHHTTEIKHYMSLLGMGIELMRNVFKKLSEDKLIDCSKIGNENYNIMTSYLVNLSFPTVIQASVVDREIRELFKLITCQNKVKDVEKIKKLLVCVKNASKIHANYITKYPNIDTLLLIKPIITDSILFSMADNIIKNHIIVKPIVKIIKHKTGVTSDDDTSDDDTSDDNTSEIDIRTDFCDNTPQYSVMPIDNDKEIMMIGEPYGSLPIDPNTPGRRIYIGPFAKDKEKILKTIIDSLLVSSFAKGQNLNLKQVLLSHPEKSNPKLTDKERKKLPLDSLYISFNDKKINSRSDKHKDKENRQSNVESDYGYDWVADMFVNIINKHLNIPLERIHINYLMGLEYRIKDHEIRNERKLLVPTKKQVLIKKVVNKIVLTKEEKTELHRKKLAERQALRAMKK